jgi:hypothetical protein
MEGRTRKRKRIKLAPKAMPFREVQKIAAEKLRDQNQGLITAGSATSFGNFIDSVYRPVDMPTFANSTRDRYESVISRHLLPVFKEVCLRDITALAAQRYVSGLAASKLAHESKDKIRDVLASIMNSAVPYQFIVKNPTEGFAFAAVAVGETHKAVHLASSVRRSGRDDRRTLRHDDLHRRLYWPEGQRTDRPEMVRHPRVRNHGG